MSLPDLVTYKGRFVENMTKQDLIGALAETVAERNQLRHECEGLKAARDEARGDVYKLAGNTDPYKEAYQRAFGTGEKIEGENHLKARDVEEATRYKIAENKYEGYARLVCAPVLKNNLRLREMVESSNRPLSKYYERLKSGDCDGGPEEGPQPPVDPFAIDFGLQQLIAVRPNETVGVIDNAAENAWEAYNGDWRRKEIAAVTPVLNSERYNEAIAQITGLTSFVPDKSSVGITDLMRGGGLAGLVADPANSSEAEIDNKVVKVVHRALNIQSRIERELGFSVSLMELAKLIKVEEAADY